MAIFDEFRERKATVSIAGMVLVVALVAIWSQTRSTTLRLNHKLYDGIGQAVAAETSVAVRDHGQIVVVLDGSFMIADAAHHDEWQEFQRELKKHPGLSLSAIKSVELDLNDTSTGCPSTAFKQYMEEYADADAIVFFISLPDWKWLQQHQLIPQRLPPHVIVVDTGALPAQGHYTDYFANGFVSELIAARQGLPPAASANPRQPREWFDQYFQVYTPENYEALAAAGANR